MSRDYCAHCGVYFWDAPQNWQRKYCSEECGAAARRERQAAYMRERRGSKPGRKPGRPPKSYATGA